MAAKKEPGKANPLKSAIDGDKENLVTKEAITTPLRSAKPASKAAAKKTAPASTDEAQNSDSGTSKSANSKSNSAPAKPASKAAAKKTAPASTDEAQNSDSGTSKSANSKSNSAPAKPASKAAAKKTAPASTELGTLGVNTDLSKKDPVQPVDNENTYRNDEEFLNSQKEALLAERATYLEQANSLREEADSLISESEPGDIQFDEESGEGGTSTVDRERDLALSAQALAAVEEINYALHKIEIGKYGICESCGELIVRDRLEALPYARLCVACKSGGLSRR
ncbi:MAG: TraR/DksA C4-type zinc finger protein [Firmicutes bacterium]|jgi:DnaK suppressor protein|nr:TraR/DksA C4-type zinc finger protein [Bacillota bacterium]